MSNNVDGIKKLNKDEVERSRKIVLDFIGEEDKRQKENSKLKATPLKKVFPSRMKNIDGLMPGKKAGVKPIKKKPTKKKRGALELTEEEARAVEAKSKGYQSKKTDVVGISDEEKNQFQGVKEESRAKVEKKEEPAIPSKSEILASKKNDEKIKIKKAKKDLITKKVKAKKDAKNKKKQAYLKAKENKKNKIKKARLKFKNDIIIFLKSIFNKKVFKYLLKTFILGFLLFLVIYLAFAFLLLKINIDNQTTRQISNYLPVPAVITKAGFISYYEYKDLLKQIEKDNIVTRENQESFFAQYIFLKSLAQKYNINLFDKNISGFYKEISYKFILDQDLNKIALSRINKIKDLIKEVGLNKIDNNFSLIGEKYSDNYGIVKEDMEDYLILKQSATSLEIGKSSNIITTSQGYYILEKDDYNLGYIFIKAMVLDKYFEKVIKDLKIVFLVK